MEFQNVDSEALAQFLSITGTNDESYARNILAAFNSDLSNSLAQHFAIQEAGGNTYTSSIPVTNQEHQGEDDRDETMNDRSIEDDAAYAAALANEAHQNLEPEVRAPLDSIVDRLVHNVLPERDGHLPTADVHMPFVDETSMMMPRGSRRSVLAQMNSVQDSVQDRSEILGTSPGLSGMYRPPNRMQFYGSFEKLLEAGVDRNKWILVNIQAHDEFACHVLNRDIWSNESLQSLIDSSFLFWQRYLISADGEKYKTYYPFTEVPHIALIDPRTGERLISWSSGVTPQTRLTIESLLSALTDFLDNHSLEETHLGPLHRRKTEALAMVAGSQAGPSSAAGTAGHLELDEDAQIAAAIAASLAHQTGESSNADSPSNAFNTEDEMRQYNRFQSTVASSSNPMLNEHRDIRREQDEELQIALAIDRSKALMQEEAEREALRQVEEAEKKERDISDLKMQKASRVPQEPSPGSNVQITELAVRLPDGERLVRRFEALNTIGNIYEFVESCTDIEEGTYELMSMYPRKSFTDHSLTLLECGLLPKAALAVHKK
uniref:UBX domain-containing protein n=1 Tax=Timspurckia oligopyrenoides TaxID=708627 RepID=A0A6T6NHI3_9RHOD|mmetsp:Transcript_6746/g.12058  ORF Transcript_6746/g.12058 Transcript_6746/m.12058 type:complete len:548 (+) Transcript_6746:146-1789(+)|eukprot:CAMPEP_0182445166 /NCGR_PEP_ID=MMETSP1172-20130603/3391_1 /TAXON_ID=708627 /ORGANISM="Timspurckia oligopyrenoides, Strain CCMP3278" /LENGTH=547 /DNA_ID=CAMNT_0024640885 /DNA_START=87 /DNA_END=1730 /DNA_ORIENTATION=-